MRHGLKNSFGLIATILGFVVDIITLAALINSNVTPRIPFIDIPLGITAKLTIWLIALVSYLGILREYWLRISRRLQTRPETTYSNFLANDIFQHFRHPFLLIPFIILAGFLISIFIQMGTVFWVILLIIGFTFLIVGYFVDQAQRSESEWETINKIDVFNRWIQRIEKEINDFGYATNYDLAHLYSQPQSLCSKALSKYFKKFESDKNLVLLNESIRVKNRENPIQILVLARRTLANSKPWRIDPRR